MRKILHSLKGSQLSRPIVVFVCVAMFVTLIAGCRMFVSKEKRVKLDMVVVLVSSLPKGDQNIKKLLTPFVEDERYKDIFLVPPEEVKIMKLDCPPEKTYKISKWKSWRTRIAQLAGVPPLKRIKTEWLENLNKIQLIEGINSLCSEQELKAADLNRLNDILADRQAFYVLGTYPASQINQSPGEQQPKVMGNAKEIWADIYKTCQENKYEKISVAIMYKYHPDVVIKEPTPVETRPKVEKELPPVAPNYIILLDNSESMGKDLQGAKNSARDIINNLRDNDSIVLITLDGQWSGNKVNVLNSISSVEQSNKWSDFGTLFSEAQGIVKSSPPAKWKIFFISDGKYEPKGGIYLDQLSGSEALAQSLALYGELKERINLPQDCNIDTLAISNTHDKVIMRKIAEDHRGKYFRNSAELIASLGSSR